MKPASVARAYTIEWHSLTECAHLGQPDNKECCVCVRTRRHISKVQARTDTPPAQAMCWCNQTDELNQTVIDWVRIGLADCVYAPSGVVADLCGIFSIALSCIALAPYAH